MAEHNFIDAALPQGYRDIPPEDQKKALAFFDRGRTVSDTGNFEYGIELFIQGLSIDPENVEAHKTLRDISLKRKASGKKDLGMMERMKLNKTHKDDPKNSMLNGEKALAYDPGNMDKMLNVFEQAIKAGFYDSALWIGGVLQKANTDSPKPQMAKFLALKDGYKSFGQWRLAVDACNYALRLRPDDMDLQKELKDLSAQNTLTEGKYGVAKSFRESIRDMDKQSRLLEDERDFQSDDFLVRKAKEAEIDWKNNLDDMAYFSKYIDMLRATELPEYENKGISLLDEMFKKSHQFKWRQKLGEIKMAQLSRLERTMRADMARDPEMKKEYAQFKRQQLTEELAEWQLILENYPTDNTARYKVAERMFLLGQYQESIPVFQQVRQDPKYRVAGSVLLGRAFLESGFADEAVETLKVTLDDYPAKGDDKSLEMYYWYGRSLEVTNDNAGAIKQYSQVAQINFNYRDVQERIKRLRSQPPK
jgi:tetratricopeptide repeat protein